MLTKIRHNSVQKTCGGGRQATASGCSDCNVWEFGEKSTKKRAKESRKRADSQTLLTSPSYFNSSSSVVGGELISARSGPAFRTEVKRGSGKETLRTDKRGRRQSERLEKHIKTKGLSEEAVSLLSLSLHSAITSPLKGERGRRRAETHLSGERRKRIRPTPCSLLRSSA